MAYVLGNQLMDEDDRPLGTFSSHWAAVAAMIRMGDHDFRSLGRDDPADLAIEAAMRSTAPSSA